MTDGGQQAALLGAYSDLIREYHATLDLVSPAALARWDDLLADALLYGSVIGELGAGDGSILDLGSGAGLPGIPLAITRPASRVLLVERRRRRTAFLQLAVSQLGLTNAEAAGTDVRDLTEGGFAVVTAQAVGSFASVHALSRHLHAPGVILAGSKGSGWEAEAAELEESAGARVAATAVKARQDGSGFVVGLRLEKGS